MFRAREVETGRILALKKVRFDNYQPESIRFMAREIMILRRLDHPNIMKLEGIITSQSSSSIYLVFEYMEHDLAGLVASSDIKFSDMQVRFLLNSFPLASFAETVFVIKAFSAVQVYNFVRTFFFFSTIQVNNFGSILFL